MHEALTAWTAMLDVLTGIHTERNQTTRPDPGQKKISVKKIIFFSPDIPLWLVGHHQFNQQLNRDLFLSIDSLRNYNGTLTLHEVK